MNLGFIRQYLGEVPPEKTFTAKELWEVFNAFAPLMSEEQEKKIVESLKSLLDTHTVKEERHLGHNCTERKCYHQTSEKEEPTTLKDEEFCYRDECPIKKMHKYSEAGCIGLPSTEEPTTPEKHEALDVHRSVGVVRKHGFIKLANGLKVEGPEELVKEFVDMINTTPEKKCCIPCKEMDIDGQRCECICHQEEKLPTSSYEVTCGRCEKSIKHSCGVVRDWQSEREDYLSGK